MCREVGEEAQSLSNFYSCREGLLDLDISAKGSGARKAKPSARQGSGQRGSADCSIALFHLCFPRHLGMAGLLDYPLEFPLFGTGCKEDLLASPSPGLGSSTPAQGQLWIFFSSSTLSQSPQGG